MEKENSSLKTFQKDYFSFSGRLNRWPYFLRLIGYFLIFKFLQIVLKIADKINGIVESIAYVLVIITVIAAFIFISAQTVKRLHDLNKSGWLILIRLIYHIPIFGWISVIIWICAIIFELYLILAKGTNGSNRFGPNSLIIEMKADDIEKNTESDFEKQ